MTDPSVWYYVEVADRATDPRSFTRSKHTYPDITSAMVRIDELRRNDAGEGEPLRYRYRIVSVPIPEAEVVREDPVWPQLD